MAKTKQLSVDETDEKILSVLLENCRQSYRQIARHVRVSVATVLYRVRALEKAGIITRYTAQIDYEKLGYDLTVVIEIRIAKGKLFDVERKIASHPSVAAVYDHTGSFDATIIAKFKNRKSMDLFLKKIQSYDFVERTETRVVLNTLKEEQPKL